MKIYSNILHKLRKATQTTFFFSLLFLICCGGEQKNEPAKPQLSKPAQTFAVPIYKYEIVGVFDHDAQAFTQGLEFFGNILYETTGQYSQSSVRMVEWTTGKVLKKTLIFGEYFGEGMTIFGKNLYHITWQSHKGFIYDAQTLKQKAEFSYYGEGWGLAHDDKSLIMSDGTNQLRFLNPETQKVERVISVYDGNTPITNLNELEYVKGEIFANIWQSYTIARIDPHTGKITGWIDLTGIDSGIRTQNFDVLNGIAYLEKEDRLFVTGKLWSKMFEIRLVKQNLPM